MISDSTHPKTRVSNTREASEARVQFVLSKLKLGEQPKCIAADVGVTDSAVRLLIRRAGYSTMFVSRAEREMIVAARRKSA